MHGRDPGAPGAVRNQDLSTLGPIPQLTVCSQVHDQTSGRPWHGDWQLPHCAARRMPRTPQSALSTSSWPDLRRFQAVRPRRPGSQARTRDVAFSGALGQVLFLSSLLVIILVTWEARASPTWGRMSAQKTDFPCALWDSVSLDCRGQWCIALCGGAPCPRPSCLKKRLGVFSLIGRHCPRLPPSAAILAKWAVRRVQQRELVFSTLEHCFSNPLFFHDAARLA